MSLTSETLRFILGLKVKNIRRAKAISLTEIAERSGMSISYLSEIENGHKFPKPEKLILLARALGVGYDELVSPRLTGDLDALEALVDSDFLKEFPFGLFGMEAKDLLGLVSNDPRKAAAFVQTFLEIGRSHDMQMDQYLFTALCSYQRLNSNYFPDLEDAASEFRRSRRWPVGEPLEQRLKDVLENEYDYVLDHEQLGTVPELSNQRSVYLEDPEPTLYLNPGLSPAQRTFIYGREIAFKVLGLTERANAWPWIQAESFQQILNNFRASYFAGALLIDGDALATELEAFFDRERWDPAAYLELMGSFSSSSAMFTHRLTEILPGRFGLKRLYSMRFHHRIGTEQFDLRKMLNMTGLPVPRGLGASEHYCGRWVTTRLLREIGQSSQWNNGSMRGPRVQAEKAHFVKEDANFFVISAAQQLNLDPNGASGITIGFLMDETFRRRVRFWNDPSIKQRDVGLSCERCPIPLDQCSVRRAPPLILDRSRVKKDQLNAIGRLRHEEPAAFEAEVEQHEPMVSVP